jgi:hypothetical protein
VSARYQQLAAHVRALPDDDLNDLLVDLPRHRFAELVDVALARPILPAGLRLRLRSAAPAEGWMVLAGRPARLLGRVTRGHPDGQEAGALAPAVTEQVAPAQGVAPEH